MSERLRSLAQQLEQLPEPADPIEKAQHAELRAVGASLASLPPLKSELWKKRAMLKQASDQIESAARIIGDSDGGIIQLLRRMRVIVNALVEGIDEPPE